MVSRSERPRVTVHLSGISVAEGKEIEREAVSGLCRTVTLELCYGAESVEFIVLKSHRSAQCSCQFSLSQIRDDVFLIDFPVPILFKRL